MTENVFFFTDRPPGGSAGHKVPLSALSESMSKAVKERADETRRALEKVIVREMGSLSDLLLADVQYATCSVAGPCKQCRALLDDEVINERQQGNDSLFLGVEIPRAPVEASLDVGSSAGTTKAILWSHQGSSTVAKESLPKPMLREASFGTCSDDRSMSRAMTSPARTGAGETMGFKTPQVMSPWSTEGKASGSAAFGSLAASNFRGQLGAKMGANKSALQRNLTTNLNFLLLPEWQDADSAEQQLGVATSVFSTSAAMEKADSELELIDEPEYREEGCLATMNPNSRHRLAWDVMGIIILVYDLMATPLEIAFTLPDTPALQVISMTVLSYWTFDIPMSFLVGYHGPDGRLIMSFHRIARKYLTTWFMLDIFLVSIDWLFTLPKTGVDLGGVSFGLTFRVLRVVRVLRLLRLGKLRPLLFKFQDHISSEYVATIVSISKYITFIIAVNHFIACGWHWLAKGFEDDEGTWTWLKEAGITDKSIVLRYATALHWSLTQFTPASMEVVPENIYERWYSVLVLLFALCVFGSFVSSVTAAMTSLRKMTTWFDTQVWLLRKYFRERGISRTLSGRIQRYVTLRVEAQRARVQESSCELLKLITPALHNELRSELCTPHLCEHFLFDVINQRSEGLIRSLCLSAFTQVRLSRSDVIFNLGHKAQTMHFITFGVVSYRPAWEDGRSTRLTNGQWCCEPSLWMVWQHVGRAHAVVESELLDLSAGKFRDVVMEHPSQVKFVRSYGASFVRQLQAIHDKGGDISDLSIEAEAADIPDLLRESSRPAFPSITPREYTSTRSSHGEIVRSSGTRDVTFGKNTRGATKGSEAELMQARASSANTSAPSARSESFWKRLSNRT
mmetsp:Transcript_68994/g.128867  ORF Transcript_68994/g.128867 Transcript_68994/m.128867 type:complete len:852 (-) Transcript_68994:196-2751(-)